MLKSKMPLDAMCLSALGTELAATVTGMKIDKVQQPERDVIVLTLRGGGNTHRLLICAGSGDARIHLTEYRMEMPGIPPMFCMLLRKHISGARILSVSQPPAERMLDITLSAPDAMGVISEKHLVIELFGRRPNVILTSEDSHIIDCLYRISGDMTGKRATLPGLFYRLPSPQEGKTDPFNVSRQKWRELFNQAGEGRLDKWLLNTFSALSPLICREITWRAYRDSEIGKGGINDGGDGLAREFFAMTDTALCGGAAPWILADAENTARDFSFTEIMQYEGLLTPRREDTFSAMLDAFFTRSAQEVRLHQRAASMEKTVRNARSRITRKLGMQRKELEESADREALRECGDIITANIHLMEKGQTELSAEDFFARDGTERVISLDPLKTPAQNAARYYKEYTKRKNAQTHLVRQIGLGENELEYLDSVIDAIARSEGERDINGIREELAQTGYLKPGKQGKTKNTESEPLRFMSSGGLIITAGRNNIQNESLTFKTALKSDLWLHAQKVPGSHVIVSCRGGEIDEASLHEGAAIAAYYSASRMGGKAAVDYTPVRHVKKKPGGKPGMVVYTDYKTVIAGPDEELVSRLRKK